MPYLNRIWYILMVYSAVFTWLQENEHMLFWFVVKALLWEYNLYGKTFTIESDLKRNLKSCLGSQYILNNMLMKGFGVSTLSLQTVLAICVHNLKHFTFFKLTRFSCFKTSRHCIVSISINGFIKRNLNNARNNMHFLCAKTEL